MKEMITKDDKGRLQVPANPIDPVYRRRRTGPDIWKAENP